ncbi:MAG: hypothetical protein ACPLZ9_04125, partial [Candidatus Ratteibacteria bacterium]
MGDKMSSLKTKRVPEKKEAGWEEDSYSKYKLINKINDQIPLTSKQQKEISNALNKLKKEIEDIKNKKEELIKWGVPRDIVNMEFDPLLTVLQEKEMFLKAAARDGNVEMQQKITDSILNDKSFNVTEFSGGYGFGEDYHLYRTEDSQAMIFYRNCKKIVEKNPGNPEILKYIDWIEVSKVSFKEGNPFARTDLPYSGEKFMEEYEKNMLNLLEKNIKKEPPIFDFSKLYHFGIDPERGEATIPDKHIREIYEKTKKEINDRIIKIIKENPYVLYLLPDILSDTTKILIEGYNGYIQTIDINNPKPVAKEIKEK